MGLGQVEQGFSSFFANFLAYLMIFQSGARTLSCLKQIFRIPGTPKIRFWVPNLHH